MAHYPAFRDHEILSYFSRMITQEHKIFIFQIWVLTGMILTNNCCNHRPVIIFASKYNIKIFMNVVMLFMCS